MKAELLIDERFVLDENTFVEIVAWQVPRPLDGSLHSFKYRLVLAADDNCVLQYDNEAGKGDRCQEGNAELPYAFKDTNTLLEDFWSDVERWSAKK